jgi:hypothetical protein
MLMAKILGNTAHYVGKKVQFFTVKRGWCMLYMANTTLLQLRKYLHWKFKATRFTPEVAYRAARETTTNSFRLSSPCRTLPSRKLGRSLGSPDRRRSRAFEAFPCHSALRFVIKFPHQETFQGCPIEIGIAYSVQRFATG